MKNITINYKNASIEITKTFEKKASAYGSAAYIELCRVRKEFPDYKLVIKESKSSGTFKGMDYNFMLEYISRHENAEQYQAEFDKLRANNLSYGEIKQWFISTYPVFSNCNTRAQWILAA